MEAGAMVRVLQRGGNVLSEVPPVLIIEDEYFLQVDLRGQSPLPVLPLKAYLQAKRL
jgi:hypothetical protein